MRDHPGVVRFRQCGDFLGAGDAAAQTHVGAEVLDRVACEQRLELIQAGETFPGRDGDVYVVRHHCHGIETIGPQRVFVEHGCVFFDAAGQRNGFGRGQAAVDFDAQIDLGADGFAQTADVVDGFLDFRSMGFVVGGIDVFVEQRV